MMENSIIIYPAILINLPLKKGILEILSVIPKDRVFKKKIYKYITKKEIAYSPVERPESIKFKPGGTLPHKFR